jgi:DNA-binding CsgD family transcriptional regulator/tetratricopeptide (TPR) repeat protein
MSAQIPMRGRDEELAEIGAALGDAARGRGATLLVEGAPGIGKSRLLAEAAATARRLHLRVGSGEAQAGQHMMPLAPLLAALFEGTSPLLDAAVLDELSGRVEERYWLLQELGALLESEASREPLVIALDDLQWADPGTLIALRTLPAGLAGLPIVWLLATRGGDAGADLRTMVSGLAHHGVRRLPLRPLSDAAVAAVVADVLRAEGEPAVMELARTAGGNPFLLRQLLEGLLEEGLVRVDGGRAELLQRRLPRRVRDSMSQRLDRLSVPTREVVTVASALGARFSVQLLAAMLDRSPADLVAPLEEAIANDLLTESEGQLTFRHALLHDGVLATLSEPMRRGLQRQAADALLAAGAEPVAVARQLAATAQVGDRPAVATLRQAAAALHRADADAAADLSVRALELTTDDDPVRAPLVVETATLLHAALRHDASYALASDALNRVLSPDDEAEVRLTFARMNSRDPEVAIAEGRRALALPGISPRYRARHLGWLTYNLVLTGRLAEARNLVDPALEAAQGTGDEEAAGALRFALALLERARGRLGPERELLNQAIERFTAAGLDNAARAADITRVRLFAENGALGDALARSSDGLAGAQREGQEWLLNLWLLWRGQLLFDAGRLRDANAEAEAAVAMGEQAAMDFSISHGHLLAGRVALHTGDAGRVQAAVAVARRLHATTTPSVRRRGSWLLALVAMAEGDPVGAATWLEDDVLPYSQAAVTSGDITHPAAVVRIGLAAGRPGLAHAAVELAERYERQNPGNPVVAAVAAASRGLLHQDVDELQRAAELYRAGGRRLALAATLEDLGLVLTGAGRPEQAIAVLTDALDVFVTIGATADTRRVHRRLRELGVRRALDARSRPRRGWGSLTEAELEVARLVAGGHTNRTVADQLSLSPHTVSSHVRHAFAKLDINSRVELARIVLEHESAGAPVP